MKNISALLNMPMFIVTSNCYPISNCIVPLLQNEKVTLKPNSYWYHELTGPGMVRIVTDFGAKNAKVYPMVLDSTGLEKCIKGEPYVPVDLDGRTPLTPQWSHNVAFYGHNADNKYYFVIRNEECREYSFGMLMYPTWI